MDTVNLERNGAAYVLRNKLTTDKNVVIAHKGESQANLADLVAFLDGQFVQVFDSQHLMVRGKVAVREGAVYISPKEGKEQPLAHYVLTTFNFGKKRKSMPDYEVDLCFLPLELKGAFESYPKGPQSYDVKTTFVPAMVRAKAEEGTMERFHNLMFPDPRNKHPVQMDRNDLTIADNFLAELDGNFGGIPVLPLGEDLVEQRLRSMEGKNAFSENGISQLMYDSAGIMSKESYARIEKLLARSYLDSIDFACLRLEKNEDERFPLPTIFSDVSALEGTTHFSGLLGNWKNAEEKSYGYSKLSLFIEKHRKLIGSELANTTGDDFIGSSAYQVFKSCLPNFGPNDSSLGYLTVLQYRLEYLCHKDLVNDAQQKEIRELRDTYLNSVINVDLDKSFLFCGVEKEYAVNIHKYKDQISWINFVLDSSVDKPSEEMQRRLREKQGEAFQKGFLQFYETSFVKNLMRGDVVGACMIGWSLQEDYRSILNLGYTPNAEVEKSMVFVDEVLSSFKQAGVKHLEEYQFTMAQLRALDGGDVKGRPSVLLGNMD